MMEFQIIAALLFVVGYVGIATEHKFHINKAAWALMTGGLLWVLVALSGVPHMEDHLVETGHEIFSLVIFLLAAMSLVEILISCGIFDALRTKMLAYKLTNRKQFLIIMAVAFFLSAIVDNLTATIIMIQISRKFFKGNNLLVAAVGVVLGANAGGAFSPIGDVTTIMLWIAGKFTAMEIILNAFLPSVVIGIIAYFMLARKIDDTIEDDTPQKHERHSFSIQKKIVMVSAAVSFVLPVLFKLIHLPPVLGILTGLGITWFLFELLAQKGRPESRLTARIEELIQKTDISSIQFFIGILLAVSALSVLGVLTIVSDVIYGPDASTQQIIVGNVILGVVSSVLDNIPLTAIAIDVLDTANTHLWILLAICVGTGGSLLAIGSAAGVVAMGLVKELTFQKYFKIAFVPALVSFLAGVVFWYGQWKIVEILF
jgi:Na+/H+ antiporter NhaD/arsenite permease-like protein